MICLSVVLFSRVLPKSVRKPKGQKKVRVQKIFDYPSSMGHYDADVCTFRCFDDRFTRATEELERAQGWTHHVDRIVRPGGAKRLICDDPSDPTIDAASCLDDMQLSVKLHHPKVIAIFLHQECGAYGDAMPKEHDKALEFIAVELRRARETIEESGLPCRIRTFAAMFDGIREIDPPFHTVTARSN
ncbi:MAG: carbonic anhydrase [Patescibacteria group bacterium]